MKIVGNMTGKSGREKRDFVIDKVRDFMKKIELEPEDEDFIVNLVNTLISVEKKELIFNIKKVKKHLC